jgi:hypothetical protein
VGCYTSAIHSHSKGEGEETYQLSGQLVDQTNKVEVFGISKATKTTKTEVSEIET